ncbi:MAG: hypothetical protein R3331_11610 [Sulfurospirillaceae bacterium]|nr:hypothetical protein [Sulfurospirillaceae bacterium]
MAENKSIQYINPVDSSLILYDGGNFVNTQKRQNLYTVSRILYECVIIYSFKIPLSQANDDLNALAEIKMYEEAGLDVNKNYKITYILKEFNFDDTNLVEAFAIDIDTLKDNFKEPIKKVKYIDFLALPFFAFSTFYKNKILTAKNDIFVYIDENESFMSFYKNATYISTKSLINLDEIIDKLNAQDIHLNIDELYGLLENKGLDSANYANEEADLFNFMESIFSDILMKIQNVALHNRNVFEFEQIDRIFFSTKKGRIKGLKNFVLNFGMSDVEVLDFNLFKEKQEDNFLDKIVASYGMDKFKEKSSEQNVTIFERRPSFLKTQAGKLITSAAVLLIIVFSIYFYLNNSILNLKKEESQLSSRYSALQQSANQYKAQIRQKNNEIIKVKADISKQKLVLENIKVSIDKLEKMRGVDNSYISFLAKVNTLLQRYGLHTKSIKQIDKKYMDIEVISSYQHRDKIASFLRELMQEGFLNVKTDEIRLNDKNYISKIGIERE